MGGETMAKHDEDADFTKNLPDIDTGYIDPELSENEQ